MKIYRPVQTDFIAQNFGKSNACCKTDSSGKPIRPFRVVTKSSNTCPVDSVEFYPAIGMKGHNGTDFAAWHGEPVYFNVDANTKWFARTEVDADGGVGLRVHSIDPLPFKMEELPVQNMTEHSMMYYNGVFSENPVGTLRVQFLYWHLKDVNLSDKPQIQIGTFSDGRPQMAYEIKFGDLIAYADNTGASSGDHLHHAMKFCNKSTMTIGSDNGYTGAVDMAYWFENSFVDVITKQLTVIELLKKYILLLKNLIKYRNG